MIGMGGIDDLGAAVAAPDETLLDHDVLGAPDWLSDEDCLHELGSDWFRRGLGPQEEEDR